MDFRAYVRDRLPELDLARDPEILDELAQHLADLYKEGRASGLSHDEALARASSALPRSPDELGRAIETASRSLPARIVNRWHHALDEPVEAPGRFTMFADLRADVRYATRMLLKFPGFAAIVIVTMALGVGANTAVFTAVDALLLRRAPIADPSRVVSVYTSNSDGRDPFSSSSYPDFVSLHESSAFDGLAAYASISLALDSNGETELVAGEVVSGNYFDVLGVGPNPGRSFLDAEDRAGTPVRVAIISHQFWQTRLGGDAAVAGRTVTLNGEAYSVVGVTPRGFRSPVLGRAPEIWVPMALQPEVRPPSAGVRRSLGSANLLGARGVRWLNMIGRLRDDGSIEQARARADAVAATLSSSSSRSNEARRFTVLPLGEGPGVRTAAAPLLRMLTAAVAFVLVIACANVAGLLLSRAVSRRREIAVRIAIGAGRGRLVRQLLTESVFLALLGAAGGLVLAVWGAPLLYGFGIPESIPLTINPRVFGFAIAAAVGSGLAFGLAPVVQTLREKPLAALRDEGGPVASGASATRMRRAFVIVQVALSLMLVVGAALFLRTLSNAYAVDLGYRVEGLLLADINLDVRGYTPPRGQALYEQVLQDVRRIPGVLAAGAARVPLLTGNARSGLVSTDGQPLQRGGANAMAVRTNVISDGYLEAMGIPVLRGRAFDPTDTAAAPPVAIISRGLAARLWGDADPIGRTLVTGAASLTIVGVVPDAVYTSVLEQNPPPFFYTPLAQGYESGMTLHVRMAADPLSIVSAVRQSVRKLDPHVVVARPRTLVNEFESSVGEPRTMALLVGLFGLIALILAAVGIYGTMSQLVAQCTAEMGLRLALGARPRTLMLLLTAEGARLVALGATLGFAGAYAGTRVLRSQLFGVEPTDPGAFAAGVTLLFAVGLLACLVPARRAMRVDPVRALRGS